MSGIQLWSEQAEKQVGARVQILLEDPYLLAAFQKFGASIVRRSSVFHGLDRFLSERGIRGRRCFEVGTWNGLTAAVLSRYFDEVVTVDIAHNDIKREVLAHLGITNVVCVDIKDNAEKAKVWKRSGPFDFAYLDGDHAHDTQDDFDLVEPCGRVLFHECWPWQKSVWELVHQLPREEVAHGGLGLALWDRGGVA